MPEYGYNQLRILWYLKKRGGFIIREGKNSILTKMGHDLELSPGGLRHHLRSLELQCVILRTYQRPVKAPREFKEGQNNPCTKIELVDPDMYLPPINIPLAVVVAKENEELAERVASEPTVESVVDALVDRALELQTQIDKLQTLVEKLSQENELLHKAAEKKPRAEHLTHRAQDVLPPEVWDRLRGK